jgi:hypothetical protein
MIQPISLYDPQPLTNLANALQASSTPWGRGDPPMWKNG